MADTVIPNGGTTDDQTPELRIVLDAPLWDGSSLHVFRNGVNIGLATARSLLEYAFTDNVVDGSYVYSARVVLGVDVTNSPNYSITVEQPESVILMEDASPIFHELLGLLLTEVQGALVE